MKSAEQLFSELQALDIKLSLADGKLRCNAPKGAMTAELRDSIKQHKPNLLRLLNSRKNMVTSGSSTVLSGIDRGGHLPLSFSQERIWWLSKLDPNHHATGNLQFAFRLQGALDILALEKTLNTIVQRHAVFRTGCVTVNQRPLQILSSEVHFTLPVRDCSHLTDLEKHSALAAALEQDALEPFDLGTAPILRAQLLNMGNSQHAFLLTTHLYVFDGWSTAVLFKELSVLYAAFQNQEASPLPPLAAQYVDFSHWHRHWFEGKEASRQSAYWKEKLKNACLVTGLPLDRPREVPSRSVSASVEFTLPSFLTEAIRSLSQQAGVTLFISLLAAFQTLLYSYTRQEKLTTGTIVSNRRLAESEQMIGSFANNILISSDFSSGITFNDLLAQVCKASREANAHLDFPFERLLGELNPELNSHPLFRVMFVLHQHQSIDNQGLTLTGLNIEKLAIHTQSKYDLELVMVDREGCLSGLFQYNARLFDRATIECFKEHFVQVLKQVTNNPMGALEQLPDFYSGQRHSITPAEAKSEIPSTAPRTPLELAVAQIWQAFLGVDTIGVDDQFTDLGGHSLLAIRLVAAIQEAFRVDIEPVSLFDFPTIAQLADFIQQNRVD